LVTSFLKNSFSRKKMLQPQEWSVRASFEEKRSESVRFRSKMVIMDTLENITKLFLFKLSD
jgi:hypothetical protein